MKKTCTKCNKEKDVSEFHLRSDNGKLRNECKSCYALLGKPARDKFEKSKHGKLYRSAYAKTDAGLARGRRYRLSEKGAASELRYNSSEKGKASRARIKARRRQRDKDTINDLTANEWNEILLMQHNLCNICSIGFEETPPQRDHIVPVFRGGSLTKDNVQALCKSCNSFKGTRLMKELTK